MARTYGEVTETSFPDIFRYGSGPHTVFVDIGSGHGTITFDAVRAFDCGFAVGIEKYREPAAICRERFAQLPEAVRGKLRFIWEDVNDCDLAQELASLSFTHLVVFCNNLAFSPGTVNRLGRQVEALMVRWPDKTIFFISTVPVSCLEPHFLEHLGLHMSWTAEPHESCVYSSCSPV